MAEPFYEIWGGDLSLLSYADGGSDKHLATADTLVEAVRDCEGFQRLGYAAHIRDLHTGEHFTPTDVGMRTL